MITRRLLGAIMVLALAACSSTPEGPPRPTSPIVVRGGDSGAVNLAGGTYGVAWRAPGCTYVQIWWAPLASGQPETEIETGDATTGAVTVELPAGPGYLNRGSNCDLEVTLSR